MKATSYTFTKYEKIRSDGNRIPRKLKKWFSRRTHGLNGVKITINPDNVTSILTIQTCIHLQDQIGIKIDGSWKDCKLCDDLTIALEGWREIHLDESNPSKCTVAGLDFGRSLTRDEEVAESYIYIGDDGLMHFQKPKKI